MSGLTRRSVRFFGENVNLNAQGKVKKETNYFRAMLNGEGIQPTEGYPLYARVKRPQRKSITVLEGYEPMTITIPLLFDESTANTIAESEYWRAGTGRENIEQDMQILEWMAGRGVAFKTPQEGGVGTPGEGNSPLITISSTDNQDKEVLLIPYQFQTAGLKWVVGASSGPGLEWDKTVGSGVLRNEQGFRVRQACVVTLTEYVQAPYDVGQNSAVVRALLKEKAGTETKTLTIPVDGRYYTLGEIATFYCANKNALGELIKANKVGSDPNKKLKAGRKIKVPGTAMIA